MAEHSLLGRDQTATKVLNDDTYPVGRQDTARDVMMRREGIKLIEQAVVLIQASAMRTSIQESRTTP